MSQPAAAGGGAPIMALVLLRTTPAGLTAERAKEIIRKELGDSVAADIEIEEKKGLITGYMFLADPFMIMIQDCVKTYVPPAGIPAAAEAIANADAKAGFLQHRAWVSVDAMLIDPNKAKGTTTADEVLDRLGRMAAELRDADCVAVYSTAHDEYLPAHAVPAERLRAGKIVDLFPRVNEVARDDADFNAAIAEAKRRWPEFLNAWERSKGEGMFIVKARFTQGNDAEHMWVKVRRIDGAKLAGELGNQPRKILSLKQGAPVTVNVSDISDWAYGTKEGAEGGFTDPSLRKMIKGK